MKQTSAAADTCVALGNDFQNCRQGTTDGCLFCIANHTLIKGNGAIANFQKKCDPVASEKRIANCDAYAKPTDADAICNRCLPNFLLSTDGKACTAIPSEQQVCASGYEKSNTNVSCVSCNWVGGWFSVDSIFRADATLLLPQRQICAKQGGGSMMIIIIVILLIVVIVAVVILMRRGKSGNEAELRGSMISKN